MSTLVIHHPPNKIIYQQSSNSVLDLTGIALYNHSNSSSIPVSHISVGTYSLETLGLVSIDLKDRDDPSAQKAILYVYVIPRRATSMEIISPPNQTKYWRGSAQAPYLSGLVIRCTYWDGDTKDYAYDNASLQSLFYIKKFSTSSPGDLLYFEVYLTDSPKELFIQVPYSVYIPIVRLHEPSSPNIELSYPSPFPISSLEYEVSHEEMDTILVDGTFENTIFSPDLSNAISYKQEIFLQFIFYGYSYDVEGHIFLSISYACPSSNFRDGIISLFDGRITYGNLNTNTYLLDTSPLPLVKNHEIYLLRAGNVDTLLDIQFYFYDSNLQYLGYPYAIHVESREYPISPNSILFSSPFSLSFLRIVQYGEVHDLHIVSLGYNCLQSIAVHRLPDQINYTVGEPLNVTGIVIMGSLRDDPLQLIRIPTSCCIFYGYDRNTAGDHSVIVSFCGVETFFDVTYEEISLQRKLRR